MPQKFDIFDSASRDRVIAHLAHLNVDKKWTVELKRKSTRRTLNQNALMWKWHSGVVKAVCTDTGNDAEDIHEFFKRKFLTPQIVEIGGETIERYSTKNLSTKEMHEFMERIYAFVTGDLGILLPLPIEYGRDAA